MFLAVVYLGALPPFLDMNAGKCERKGPTILPVFCCLTNQPSIAHINPQGCLMSICDENHHGVSCNFDRHHHRKKHQQLHLHHHHHHQHQHQHQHQHHHHHHHHRHRHRHRHRHHRDYHHHHHHHHHLLLPRDLRILQVLKVLKKATAKVSQWFWGPLIVPFRKSVNSVYIYILYELLYVYTSSLWVIVISFRCSRPRKWKSLAWGSLKIRKGESGNESGLKAWRPEDWIVGTASSFLNWKTDCFKWEFIQSSMYVKHDQRLEHHVGTMQMRASKH